MNLMFRTWCFAFYKQKQTNGKRVAREESIPEDNPELWER
jgi:hypothetical protein